MSVFSKLAIGMLAVGLVAGVAQAQLTILNGGFETPTIDDNIAGGANGTAGTWTAPIDFDNWVESGSTMGANVSMVVDGAQNMYWNDPVGA